MGRWIVWCGVLLAGVFAVSGAAAADVDGAAGAVKKIVLIAGPKSHGPVGNGIHDYPWSVKLLKVMLDNSNVRDKVRVEFHLDGFPEDRSTLDDADSIMVISDGRDGDKYVEAPHFGSEENLKAVQKQIDRGCGFLTFHFSTFAPDAYAKQILDWSGGYFDWETDGKREWYSAIQTQDTDVSLAAPEHPVLSGVLPFKLREEFYFNLRFSEGDEQAAGLTPLFNVPSLPGREPDGGVVAWAKQRANGGRGFGTSCGHFYDNWKNDDFRRTILNAIVWTSGLDVPDGGVMGRYYSHAEIAAALAGVEGTAQATVGDGPIKALLITGNEAHKWHNWEKSTPAVQASLERDPRIQVEVQLGFEGLATRDLSHFDLIVQNNFANWHDPKQLSEAAQTAFVNFLQNGGGLLVIHFANGAFNFSLPMAGESDWPEYRNIVRRVWNHHGEGDAKSGHDRFGPYTVRVTDLEHPVTNGLSDFDVTDELYFKQDGTEPVEPLITAHSTVTDRDEPLAFAYRYGNGRVFQTLLGHSEKTYEAFEAREIVRRAAAFVADRKIVELKAENDPYDPAIAAGIASTATTNRAGNSVAPPAKPELTDGRFGNGLNAAAGGLLIEAQPEHRNAPVSVDLWAKLDSKAGFNILVASEPKASKTHWEMYSHVGAGHFAVYLPGRGGDYRTAADIADGKWHHVAMTLEAQRLRLFVDGRLVLDKPVPGEPTVSTAGAIAFGRLVEGGIGCAGVLDDVRFRRGVQLIETLPTEAATIDSDATDDPTIGLWRFETLDEKSNAVPDESPRKVSAASASTPRQAVSVAEPNPADAVKKKDHNHWGREEVGFDWTEGDSVDGRWQQAEVGRWLGSLIDLPGGQGQKSLCLRVGERQDGTFCFDTESCRMRAAWTGSFLQFNPARYGIIAPARPLGELVYSLSATPRYSFGKARYGGMFVHGDRVVLDYSIGGTAVRESPWLERVGGATVLTRTLEIGPRTNHLFLPLLEADQPTRKPLILQDRIAALDFNGRTSYVAVTGSGGAMIEAFKDADDEFARYLNLKVMPGAAVTLQLVFWTAPELTLEEAGQLAAEVSPPEPLAPLAEPGAPQWTDEIVTQGKRGRDDAPYVLDTVALPFDNPYRALLFVSGHDVLSNGDWVLCTVHGDVWTVSGVDDNLDRLVWRRFATGLFQPLGLVVKRADGRERSADGRERRDEREKASALDPPFSSVSPPLDQIFVLGRDQITRLQDRNGDGEADFYECFNNAYQTSSGGHDYVTCLEIDSQGDFYFAHARQGVCRVSADGSEFEVIATGLRNPNGLGVGANDVITAAPQEGEWTPASAIFEVQRGNHFGYGGPKITNDRPLGFDPPLCWIPRRVDNSSGGQVFVNSERWGPLNGQLLHFSFGQCRMSLALRGGGARTEGRGPDCGGVIELPLNFDSGVMRGRFSPIDGQLYVSGMTGWVTSAVQDGCLQRVRFTGQPVDLPVKLATYQNGVALTFTRPLRKEIAESTGSFHLEQWNYRYSSAYGSAEYRVSDPREQGRDAVPVRSATRLDDRTVFLEIPELKPVQQMAISWSLKSDDGAALRQTLYATINRVSRESIPEDRLNRKSAPAQIAESSLRPGLLLQFEQNGRTDTRRSRLAALSVPAETAPTPFLERGAFNATFRGFIRVPLSGEYSFATEGTVASRLLINGVEVPDDGSRVELRGGNNELQVELASSSRRSRVRQNAGEAGIDARAIPRALANAATSEVNASESANAATFRLLWSSAEFAQEPLPPDVLFCRGDDAELLSGEQLRRGRELFATLHCAECHLKRRPAVVGDFSRPEQFRPARSAETTASGMFELGVRAPRLDIGNDRLTPEWIRFWLTNPRGHSEHRTMPDVLGLADPNRVDGPAAAQVEQDAADLAAWLTSRSIASANQSAARPNESLLDDEGRFLDLGCVACHHFKSPIDSAVDLAQRDEFNRRSLHFAGTKYQSSHLIEFLKSPQARNSHSRMPDFRLTNVEAESLSRHIRNKGAHRLPQHPESPTGNADRGRELFQSRGCASCHTTNPETINPETINPARTNLATTATDRLPIPLIDPDSATGCLAESFHNRAGVPQYLLGIADRAALRRFVRTGFESLDQSVSAETSQRLVQSLRCTACHDRDTERSPREIIVTEESLTGLPPDILPVLSWTGEKLHADWTAEFLSGRGPRQLRSWLKTRMPAFPAYARAVSDGLAAEHGIAGLFPAAPTAPAVSLELAALGDRLTRGNGGLDCRQCHGVATEQPRGDERTKIALGINFSHVRERLRRDFYERFVLDPPRFDRFTKMPKLAVDGQHTKATEILDGNARQQFDAVWNFIQTVEPLSAAE